MESKPETDGPPNERSAGPAADLALLDRSRAVVDVDQVLDFGPWWYAPLWSTTIGGLTLWAQEFTGRWNLLAGALAVVAGTIISLHDYRRRGVRTRTSSRNAFYSALIALGFFIVIGAWGTAISTIGWEAFVPVGAAVAWLLTTVLFLAVRSVLTSVRQRRSLLA